ncbi:amidohydrolase family protein [Cupriavidus basilensis]
MKELGWYVQVAAKTDGIATQLAAYDNLDVPILLDHMGRADPTKREADPNLVAILERLKPGATTGSCYLSPRRSRAKGHPWNDVVPLAQSLIDAAPDRCVWGSDWPHPVSAKQPPNEGDLLEVHVSLRTRSLSTAQDPCGQPHQFLRI